MKWSVSEEGGGVYNKLDFILILSLSFSLWRGLLSESSQLFSGRNFLLWFLFSIIYFRLCLGRTKKKLAFLASAKVLTRTLDIMQVFFFKCINIYNVFEKRKA